VHSAQLLPCQQSADPGHTRFQCAAVANLICRLSAALRSLAMLVLLPLCTDFHASGHLAQAQEISESELKGAFIVNFLKFTEFSSSYTELTICIAGESTVLSDMPPTSIGAMHLTVRNIDASERLTLDATIRSCQVLYIPDLEAFQLKTSLAKISSGGVLTIGDDQDFLDRGGLISFFTDNHKMRFAVRLESIERSGLKLSSKLMALAKLR